MRHWRKVKLEVGLTNVDHCESRRIGRSGKGKNKMSFFPSFFSSCYQSYKALEWGNLTEKAFIKSKVLLGENLIYLKIRAKEKMVDKHTDDEVRKECKRYREVNDTRNEWCT